MSGHAAASAPRTEVPTREGPASVRAFGPPDGVGPAGTLLLGHGAGGHRDAADLLALTDLASTGWTVVLVDQPWRVAGRRVAPPPPALDRAFADLTRVIGESQWQSRHGIPLPRPWVLGGRSAGARVACRAAVEATGARAGTGGVVCLAFPLHPPGAPGSSRAHELAGPVAAGLPTLVLQGDRDPFGSAEEVRAAVRGPSLIVSEVRAAHSPARDLATVRARVHDFLEAVRAPGSV